MASNVLKGIRATQKTPKKSILATKFTIRLLPREWFLALRFCLIKKTNVAQTNMSLNANRHKKSTSIYVESYNIPQKNHAIFGYVTNRVHTNATSQVLSFIIFSDAIILGSLCCLGVVKIISHYKKNNFFSIMKLFDAEKEKMTSENEI